MKASEAYDKYNDAEAAARQEYLDYWAAKFGAVGITLVPIGAHLEGEYQGYKLKAYVYPRYSEGINVVIECTNALGVPHTSYWPHRHDKKVKSDSGFNKLVKNLQRRVFK